MSRVDVISLLDRISVDKDMGPSPESSHDDHHNKRLVRHRLHRAIVARITARWSSRLIRAKIRSFIGEHRSVLDISCGYDSMILEVAALPSIQLCVANDHSPEMVGMLRQQHRKASTLLFTSADALHPPFKRTFDLVLCKNTLHHMRDQDAVVRLLSALEEVAARAIVVDIEDPRRSSWLAYAWHRYYRDVLGYDDNERFFFTREEFKALFKAAYPHASLHFDGVKTLKGTYLFCVADFVGVAPHRQKLPGADELGCTVLQEV